MISVSPEKENSFFYYIKNSRTAHADKVELGKEFVLVRLGREAGKVILLVENAV